jgi:hypothetical protein
VNDMFADAVLSAILKCESLQGSRTIVLPTTVDHARFKVLNFICLRIISV